MKKLGVFIPIFLTIVLAFSMIPSLSAQTQLFYDDGSEEDYDCCDGGDEFYAVKFSLPAGWSHAKLLSVSFFKTDMEISAEADDFKVHIYDSDLTTELITPFVFTIEPPGGAWKVVTLPSTVIVTTEFYVAAEWLHGDPCIGKDTNSPDGRTYHKVSAGDWIQINSFDIMFRATVEEYEEIPHSVGGIYAPNDKLNILAPYIAIVGLIGAISSIFVIRRWRKD
ncbi:hypothetical protein AC481_03180 [miscellaneous Crenarchaeota group archaeon SMTZ-80]|nr:MAG: hypothetical protein AC481_03180 [miscellaneous Crenarchaeota group archaeon SMTZ-80]